MEEEEKKKRKKKKKIKRKRECRGLAEGEMREKVSHLKTDKK